ncbi:DUF2336 domain-containing protein [Nisaea acidiphila]|uniref:DUF2336 domain-containing protein n=1 Tax=Nisaea acidiphila TaxID=1862145 RepID=A0A9J7AW22_9PROT|nr:DUF2336 domain-containing protein [Nisaea acidiphila]UUX51987.1 DUF2336 domain-containing protein [Nisaea acidiphila]
MTTKPKRRMSDADRTAYEKAKGIAASTNLAERRRLAEDHLTPPEILFFLAEDDNSEIREAVAANTATPRHADQFLAKDESEDVRSIVARKVAALAPDLSSERRESIRKLTVEVLETLALDHVDRVRAVLADAVKDLPDAPPEMISRVIEVLARDTTISVSGPILEHSPLLADELLVEIIRNEPVAGAIAAISRRQAVSETVSDAVISAEDDAAIAELLGNRSAQIREETLDDLIENATERRVLHRPLVTRPKLLGRHALSLARFVGYALVAELGKRTDLGAEASAQLARELERRLEENPELAGGEQDGDAVLTGRERAKHMYESGTLTESVVLEAVSEGKRPFVLAALELVSGLSEEAVHSLASSVNPKAIVALVWKSGYGMDFALQMQLRLANIPPDKALKPTEDGLFPLSEDQLSWQIELVTEEEEEDDKG